VAKLDTMMSVAFGKDPTCAYSCGATGLVYIWRKNVLERTVQAHQGPCFAIHSLDKAINCYTQLYFNSNNPFKL